MLLPNQTKPVARALDAASAARGARLGASVLTKPAETQAILRPPSPFPMGPVSPGIVDPCQAMCAGSSDPNCWSKCGASRSPWLY